MDKSLNPTRESAAIWLCAQPFTIALTRESFISCRPNYVAVIVKDWRRWNYVMTDIYGSLRLPVRTECTICELVQLLLAYCHGDIYFLVIIYRLYPASLTNHWFFAIETIAIPTHSSSAYVDCSGDEDFCTVQQDGWVTSQPGTTPTWLLMRHSSMSSTSLGFLPAVQFHHPTTTDQSSLVRWTMRKHLNPTAPGIFFSKELQAIYLVFCVCVC